MYGPRYQGAEPAVTWGIGGIGEKTPSDGDFFTSLLTDGKRVESVFWGEMSEIINKGKEIVLFIILYFSKF